MTTVTATLIPTADTTLQRIAAALEGDPRLRSPNTKRGYLHDLAAFETWRAGRPIAKLLVEAYAAELQQVGKSPNTVNRSLAAIRWWARRLSDLAHDTPAADPEARAHRAEIVAQAERVAAVKDVRGERAPKGRHIASGELAALLRACSDDHSPAGTRDAAIIALAWSTGARRSELAGLTFANYEPTAAAEGDLRIHGKGDKDRMVYVFNGAANYLADWLALRGDAAGPLFYAINKGGVIQVGHGVSDEALAQMLQKRRAQAGVKPLSWHDFRRSFAGNLLDNGNDLATVQKLMGHASPTTTAGYDRRGEEVKRRASKSLHVSYIKSRLQ
jgi:site-specific recombinase XerD